MKKWENTNSSPTRAILSSSWCEYYKEVFFATKKINYFVSIIWFIVFFIEVTESCIYRVNSIK